jgi:glycosyltransferase involved in cell wall biosynthesis
MNKKKVVILQNTILDYRLPVYDFLSQNYDLTVIHTGKLVDSANFKQVVLPMYTFFGFVWVKGLKEKIYDVNPDIVVSMFDLHWINYLIVSMKPNGYKVVLWGHRYNNKNTLNKIKNYFLLRADGVLQYSDIDNEKLIQSGVSPEKISVAWNTIKVKSPEDTSLLHKTKILFVGRAQKRKKVELLLKAYANSPSNLKEKFSIDIVGGGEHNNTLLNLAIELNISDNVNFLGPIYNEEKLKEIFGNAVCYFSPGPVGLGLVHAQAYGVPVVTCKNEYHGPEVRTLDDNNSILYNDQSQIENTLLELLDSKKLSRISNNSHKTFLEKSSFENMMKGFTSCIDNLI